MDKRRIPLHTLKCGSYLRIELCLRSTPEDNVEGFVRALQSEKVIPVPLAFKTFDDVFSYLNTLKGTFNIIIDEYPYLKAFAKPETVDSVFQSIIDNHLGNIRLFLSGSHVEMMKDLLEEKNALYGRFSLTLHLKELNYRESALFYPEKPVYDKAGLYAVFGGSPYINGFLDPGQTLSENIIGTVLNESHPVYQYAEHLLISDDANMKSAERILSAIANGKKKYSDIENALGMKNNGLLSKQLSFLLRMEIVSKTFPVNKPDDSKKCSYEINDNLLRFFFSYVYRNKSALRVLGPEAFFDAFVADSLTTFISHRFEEIARAYFSLRVRSGSMKGITNIGTYYYDDSVTRTKNEFDAVLERGGTVDVYEVKYTSSPLRNGEMKKEEEQIRKLKGLRVGRIGFVSVSGFEQNTDAYDLITGEDLYS